VAPVAPSRLQRGTPFRSTAPAIHAPPPPALSVEEVRARITNLPVSAIQPAAPAAPAAPVVPVVPEAAPVVPVVPEAAPAAPVLPEVAPAAPVLPEVAPAAPVLPEVAPAAQSNVLSSILSAVVPETTPEVEPVVPEAAPVAQPNVLSSILSAVAPETPPEGAQPNVLSSILSAVAPETPPEGAQPNVLSSILSAVVPEAAPVVPEAAAPQVARPLHAPPPPRLGTTETGRVTPAFVPDTQQQIASIVSAVVPGTNLTVEDVGEIPGLLNFLAEFERDNTSFTLTVPDASGNLPELPPGTPVINVSLTSGEEVKIGITPGDSTPPPDSVVVVARHSKLRTPPNRNIKQYLNEV